MKLLTIYNPMLNDPLIVQFYVCLLIKFYYYFLNFIFGWFPSSFYVFLFRYLFVVV